MTQLLSVHPDNPQARLLKQAAEVMRKGGLVVYPTDTTYALGCHIGDKPALNRLIALRRLSSRHQFTLVCRDLSDLGTYARVDNVEYRLLRRYTPGPFTWILRATREVPKRLVHEKRRTIGLRVPDNNIVQMLLELMGEPIMTTTLQLPDEDEPLTDAWDIYERIGHQVDLVIDGGPGGSMPSTVVDLCGDVPEVVRQGTGVLDVV